MGITPETSENGIPLQLLANDGNLYFNPKADLLKYFQDHHEDIYISDKELMRRTDNGVDIVAWIRDMMFTFRTLKASKWVTYGKMCRTKASQTVQPIIRKMSRCLNSHSSDIDKKIVVQVFDRRADPTKGATERKRSTIQTGPFEYSTSYNIDFKGKLTNYWETFRDIGFGRKKNYKYICKMARR